MKQMTVKELLKLCMDEVQNGNGDKNIVVGDDTEGNGYHGLFFGFSDIDDEFLENDVIYESNTKSADDTIILG